MAVSPTNPWCPAPAPVVGGSYSALHYILGDTLDDLDAHGTASVISGWVKHPFLRTRTINVYGQFQYDQLDLRDHIDVAAIHTDRQLDNWTASVAGDERDSLLGGGITVWRADLTSGHVGFEAGAASVADAATAGTRGGFTKLAANVGRLQKLSPTDALYPRVHGPVGEHQFGFVAKDDRRRTLLGARL